jgi:outer membrane lipoprotein carrier protein
VNKLNRRRFVFICFYLCSSVASFALYTHAQAQTNPIEQFRAFVQSTQSARAEFSQTMTDAKGKVSAPQTGSLQFQRPGKFRWVIDKPAQTIVGDGKKVWLYDQDLNQVTIRKLEAAFSSTPAALLAGRAEVEAAFILVAGGTAEELNWVNAEPKQKDSGIEKIRMGFAGNDLRVMELADAFGNRTRITISKLQKNPKLDGKEFTFVPPKGADVVGE